MPKIFINRLVPSLARKRFTIAFSDFKKNAPILIYQMSKVGSSSVYKTIKSLGLPNPTYHVHLLSRQGIKDAKEWYSEKGMPVSNVLKVSEILSRKVEKTKEKVKWKVITLVRDPVAWELSVFFQVGHRVHQGCIKEDGRYDYHRVKGYFLERFAQYNEKKTLCCKWFDDELKRTFGVDVYDHRFDWQKKYSIISKDNVEVLVLRLEDLNETFSPAVSSFLNISNGVRLLSANVGVKKSYSDMYVKVRDHLRIPIDICEKVYSTKYATHFYSEEERKDFSSRWAEARESM